MADMEDGYFAKRNPQARSLASKAAEIDLNEGTFRLPGGAPMDLVGVDPKKLQERRDEFLKLRARVQRDMRSEWQCTQCKKTFMGRNLRVVVRGRVEVLVCPDKRCDAPVVRIKDPDEPRLVR